MKTFKELFDRYSRGVLEDHRIDEMNGLLIDAFFNDPASLESEERFYTEGLVLELYLGKDLDEELARKFREMISHDRELQKRVEILQYIISPVQNVPQKSESRKPETEETEKQEDEALEAILEDVIAQAHAEEEASPSTEWLDNFMARMRNFFQQLMVPFYVLRPQEDSQLAPVYVLRPQVKVAMAFASVSVVFIFIWFTIIPGHLSSPGIGSSHFTANYVRIQDDNSGNRDQAPEIYKILNPDPSEYERMVEKNIQRMAEEESRLQKIIPNLTEIKDLPVKMTKKLLEGLARKFFRPGNFSIFLDRGESSDAEEMFCMAADKYNGLLEGEKVPPDYTGSINILTQLLESGAFKDPDTLNQVRYLLGNSYLAKGISSKNPSLVNKALEQYSLIDHPSSFDEDILWFSSLAYLELNKPMESLILLDSLQKAGSLNYLDAGALQDSIRSALKK